MSPVRPAGGSPVVSVVIPYFQRDSAVLRRAVESVGGQRFGDEVEVLVVDDSSPVPAEESLRGVELPANIQVRIVHQPNGGPASARNRGLRERSASSRYIAFLDSDDTWSPDHLQRAVVALTHGASFYFADHFQLGQAISAFDRAKRIDVRCHENLAALDDAFFFQGEMRDQIFLGNVIGTSTVVFDARRHPGITFREEFYSAGEDYLCWLDFAADGARFAFSVRPEATYGRGVNVYSGAVWGTDEHLIRIQNEIRFLRTAVRIHRLSEPVRRHIAARQRSLHRDFVGSLIQRIRSTRAVPWRIVWLQARANPFMTVAGVMSYVGLKL